MLPGVFRFTQRACHVGKIHRVVDVVALRHQAQPELPYVAMRSGSLHAGLVLVEA